MPSTTCGWCNRHSNMSTSGPSSEAAIEGAYGQVAVTGSFSCDYCHRLSIALIITDDLVLRQMSTNALFEAAGDGLLWLPPPRQRQFPDVPGHIGDAATEAYRCRSWGANRAAVLLARSVVEATAKHNLVIEGNLKAKIDELATQGIIRMAVAAAAHEIRHLGNDMAHGDFTDPITDEEADEILNLMADVLHEVYESPARTLRAQAARQSRRPGPATETSPPK